MIRKNCSLLCATSLFVGFGLLLVSCDQKPQGAATPASGQKAKKKSSGSPDTRFVEARSQLIEGKFAEAAESLGETATEPKIRQPLLNWIDFHEGLALLLTGKEKESREAFGRIDDRGLFTKSDPSTTKGPLAPEMAQEAAFFLKLAHQLRGTEGIAAAEGRDYDKWSFEGIAYLALALKDWNLEKFDDAVALFRQFNDVAPDKRVDWADGPEDLKKLKELADNFVNDYKEYEPARKALDAAKTPEEQADAVAAAKIARSKMKLATKFSKSLDETIDDLGPKAAAMIAEKDRANNEMLAADEKALNDAKEKRAALLAKFQFAEARKAMQVPRLKIEKARDEQTLLAQKATWLANFKAQLLEDLNKKGYAEPIKTKSGETLAGGVARADDDQLALRAPKGPPALSWADLAPESAYAMGLSFIQPDMPAEITGFRKWHLGTYAFFIGKTKEGLDLMHAAAELRPVFKDALPIFENASGPY